MPGYGRDEARMAAVVLGLDAQRLGAWADVRPSIEPTVAAPMGDEVREPGTICRRLSPAEGG